MDNQPNNRKALVLEFDNVIYPEKDYLLQVYYLFAQFMEYSIQAPAAEMIQFMANHYEKNGSEGIFSSTANKFSIPEKFEANFNTLHKTARLPLKLLLFKDKLEIMQEAIRKGEILILVVEGDPEIQLNKIKQIEWNGIEKDISVFFLEELGLEKEKCIPYFAEEYNLLKENICIVTN